LREKRLIFEENDKRLKKELYRNLRYRYIRCIVVEWRLEAAMRKVRGWIWAGVLLAAVGLGTARRAASEEIKPPDALPAEQPAAERPVTPVALPAAPLPARYDVIIVPRQGGGAPRIMTERGWRALRVPRSLVGRGDQPRPRYNYSQRYSQPRFSDRGMAPRQDWQYPYRAPYSGPYQPYQRWTRTGEPWRMQRMP
jgi:hypothetical protein